MSLSTTNLKFKFSFKERIQLLLGAKFFVAIDEIDMMPIRAQISLATPEWMSEEIKQQGSLTTSAPRR